MIVMFGMPCFKNKKLRASNVNYVNSYSTLRELPLAKASWLPASLTDFDLYRR
jgi:hypothetical protein